jgi:pterin-4a-carbinolamine dehydratase
VATAAHPLGYRRGYAHGPDIRWSKVTIVLFTHSEKALTSKEATRALAV